MRRRSGCSYSSSWSARDWHMRRRRNNPLHRCSRCRFPPARWLLALRLRIRCQRALYHQTRIERCGSGRQSWSTAKNTRSRRQFPTPWAAVAVSASMAALPALRRAVSFGHRSSLLRQALPCPLPRKAIEPVSTSSKPPTFPRLKLP